MYHSGKEQDKKGTPMKKKGLQAEAAMNFFYVLTFIL